MRLPLLSFLIFLSINSFSQTYNWANKINVPQGYRCTGIVTDNSGNVYCYGNSISYSGIPIDKGSFLTKYDESGNEVFIKEWATSFYITKLIFNPQENTLNATGFFKGSIAPDDIHLSSNGETDGFIASVSTTGIIEWATGFGGASDDNSNDICLSNYDSKIYVTGSCSGTIICNNQNQASCDQSMFIAGFESNGSISSFNTFDFYPAEPDIQGLNCGRYISTDNTGNIYVFANVEGRPWSDFNNPKPKAGEYVVKTNNGTLLWSTYIISSECYYGHSYGNLEIDSQGKIHVRKRCDWKYGGEGYITTLDGFSGNIVSEYGEQQSEYYDIHCANEDLFVVGTELAYGCPCPGNDFGHKIFKRMNTDGTARYQGVFDHGYPLAIMPGSNNKVFIMGYLSDTMRISNLELVTPYGDYRYFLISVTEPSITGEKLLEKKDIKIFPNPANATLEIKSSNQFNCIEIIDESGRSIMNKSFGLTKNKTINTSGLKNGNYTVILYGSEVIIRREKILIVH